MTAFLEVSEGGYESYHKSAELDEARDWFEKLLTGSAALSGWEKIENGYDDEDESGEEEDTEWEENGISPGEAEDSPEDTDGESDPIADFDKHRRSCGGEEQS